MRYLTLDEVLELYRRIIEQSGGSAGVANQVVFFLAIQILQLLF